MTWKTLGEALNGATAKGFDIGEMAAATASQPTEFGEPTDHEWTAGPCRAADSQWMAATTFWDSKEPSSLSRPVLRNGKREPAHDPTSAPPLGAGSRLLFRVIEGGGGRREEGGPCVRRLRVSPRRKASELGWVVHSAAS